MSAIGKKMKPIDEEIARVDAEIARLQGVREGLLRAKSAMQRGAEGTPPVPTGTPRKRSPNIKPLILDMMTAAAPQAPARAVSAAIKEKVPTVAKDTVGSVLSRLKADGALAFDGERYYATRFAPPKPQARPFEPKVVRAN